MHDIVFEKVSFTYPVRDAPAIRNVSLRIPAGASVAFVGTSGAGKSTIVDLVLGLLTPSEGRILVDGTDITTVLRQWRSTVGYVPQEASLFDVSVGQGLRHLVRGNGPHQVDPFVDTEVLRLREQASQVLVITEGEHHEVNGGGEMSECSDRLLQAVVACGGAAVGDDRGVIRQLSEGSESSIAAGRGGAVNGNVPQQRWLPLQSVGALQPGSDRRGHCEDPVRAANADVFDDSFDEWGQDAILADVAPTP